MTPHSLKPESLESLAARTHGFVGADLASLVHSAGLNAIRRGLKSNTSVTAMTVAEEDIESALLVTRPSAMREVFLELPQVRWSDIGGQESVKQKLRECVEWPLTWKDTFERLGIRPPTGILLYGPPGNSKTLIAKAMATEAGLNFLAVKGPEVRLSTSDYQTNPSPNVFYSDIQQICRRIRKINTQPVPKGSFGGALNSVPRKYASSVSIELDLKLFTG